MILIVSYDLKGRRDYVSLYEALKQQGLWWHYLSSTWLLSTWKSPQDVTEALRPYMDENDSLLVAEMGTRYQGYLPKPAWEWIQNQLLYPPSPRWTPPPSNPFTTPPAGSTGQPHAGFKSALDAILGTPAREKK